MAEINVKIIKDKICEELKERVAKYKMKYKKSPLLAIVLVGDNKASESYVRTKSKMCLEIGIETIEKRFKADVDEAQLVKEIEKLNKDKKVNAIIVQLPLPEHINSFSLIEKISPLKDVDGLTTYNQGHLFKDRPLIHACTPKGILKILDYYNIETKGKVVCIINRSNIVGRPLIAELISSKRNATVISCNSYTKNLAELIKISDIIISASGKAQLVDERQKFKEGAVFIDVSINRMPDLHSPKGYVVCGDLKKEDAPNLNIRYTPVPGGVGLMTVMMLLENTIELAELQEKKG